MGKTNILSALFIVALNTNSVFAAKVNPELPDYKSIKVALTTGQSVSVVTDFSKCKGDHPGTAIGGLHIASFLIMNNSHNRNEYITFSDYHQRLKNTDNLPQVEFIDYKVTTDNNASLNMRLFPFSEQTPHEPRNSVTCPVGKGIKFYLISWH